MKNSRMEEGDCASSASLGVGAISFDPYSKCIRTKATSLQGVIVEMSPGAEAFFAKIARNNGEKRAVITGEIIDIVDHNVPAPEVYDKASRQLPWGDHATMEWKNR